MSPDTLPHAGDDGTTALARGPRRLKYDLRIASIGTVEETNALIGQARLLTADQPKLDTLLTRVQNDLLELALDLATPGDDMAEASAPRLSHRQTAWLDMQLTGYDKTRPLRSDALLPGGTPLAASLHLARAVCRRAERLTVELLAREPDLNPNAIAYLNRLGDVLLMLAQLANETATRDRL